MSIKYAELPLVSVIPDTKVVKAASAALQELDDLQQLIEGYKERQEELKLELAGYQKQAGTEGLRWGSLVFVDALMPGRKTLVTSKLMEVAGVTPAQIAECTTVGKPFAKRTFKNLTKPEKPAKDGEE